MTTLYIAYFPEEPIPVSQRNRVTIGRGDWNDIILHEVRVSRNHARLEWDESNDSLFLYDRKSLNGTYLNGERIEADRPYIVRHQDKIRVASSIFNCCAAESIESLKNEYLHLRHKERFAVTEAIAIAEMKSNTEEADFSGELDHLCPIELFQIFETGCKSGTLTIRSGSRKGSFVIQKGQIINATFDNKTGDKAVFDVLSCNKGRFSFNTQYAPAGEPEIMVPTTHLLMEGCRLLDETGTS